MGSMRPWLSLFLVCASVLGRAAPAAAAPPPIAVPTSKWVIEFEHERCTAARAYSDGTREFAIGFQPIPTLGLVELIVQIPKTVNGLKHFGAQLWLGGGERIDAYARAVATTKPGLSRYSLDVGRNEVERLVQNPDLRIASDEGPPVHVRLDEFPEVVKTLKECEAGLLEEWGLSRVAQESLRSFPQPKAEPAAYFFDEDYPTKAAQSGAIGAIEARITVNTDGRPVDCHIMQTSGHKDLDDATCVIFVKRARFEPARDKSGNPLTSPYVFRVTWWTGV